MAELSCQSCEEIKQEVPSLVTNGLSSTMCASLKNDTGLKASSGNDDCEDLNNLNDCLVGNMETEIDRYDVCEWKPFTKKLIDNLYTTLKAMICAICGIWTNIHNLWTTIRSLCLKKEGNKIVLYSNLGDHCSVTDSDTTYDLTKSGNKIILTGSDGSRDEVTDSNTTYDLTINGHTVHLNGSDGTDDSVTVPDNDTKYGLSRSGHTVTIVEGGTNKSVTIPDDDTWQPNTANQAGYVTKGDGHENKVWATDDDGVPAWRDKGAIDGRAFVRFYRDLGTGSESVPYWDNITADFERTLDIYMNPSGMSGGNLPADRDYVVIVSNCTNLRYFGDINAQVTVYSSGDTRSIATLRSHLGQHPSVAIKQNGQSGVIQSDSFFENFSWTTSSAVLIKKGEHIKVNFHVSDAKAGASNNAVAPSARMHQFVCTWIPVAVEIN